MSNVSAIFKELVFDTGRYWEPMRIAYNLVLATLSVVCWAPEMFSGRVGDFIAASVVLLVFAIPANIVYCAAYPIDFVFQLTPLRAYRQPCRWILLLSGTALASACALWVLLGDHMA